MFSNNAHKILAAYRRKYLGLLLMVPALAALGCAPALRPQAGTYVPGIYEGVGEGMHGDIVVETEFSTTNILAVKVIHHEDTPMVSDAAIDRIPAAIVKAQNVSVDAVSGATVTSKGIMAAVQHTISQALRR